MPRTTTNSSLATKRSGAIGSKSSSDSAKKTITTNTTSRVKSTLVKPNETTSSVKKVSLSGKHTSGTNKLNGSTTLKNSKSGSKTINHGSIAEYQDEELHQHLMTKHLSPGLLIAQQYLPDNLVSSSTFLPSKEQIVSITPSQMKLLYAAKCEDQQLPLISSREERFFELIYKSCNGLLFSLKEHGLGTKSAEALVDVLSNNTTYSILELSGNRLRDSGTVALAELMKRNQTIVRLDLRSNDIGSKGATALFSALLNNISLTSLDLSGLSGINRNHIGNKGAEMLKDLLRVNPVLSHLNLASNGMGPDGIKLLCEGLEGNQVVTFLDVSSNNMGVHGCESIASILDKCALKKVIMERNQIGDRGASLLAAALENQGTLPLSHLDISYNGITKNGAKVIADALKTDCPLKSLKMDGNEFGDDVEPLASMLEVNRKLKHLSISKNEIENRGCKALGLALKENKTLKKFDISSNYIDEGAISLAQALTHNKVLTHIDVSNNRIDNSGGEYFAKMLKTNKTLLCLNMKQNDMKEKAAKELAEAMRHNTTLQEFDFSYNNFEYKSYTLIMEALKRNVKKFKASITDRLLEQIEELKPNELELIAVNEDIDNERRIKNQKLEQLRRAEEDSERTQKECEEKLKAAELEYEQITERRKEVVRQYDLQSQAASKQASSYDNKVKKLENRLQTERQRLAQIEKQLEEKKIQLDDEKSKFKAENKELFDELEMETTKLDKLKEEVILQDVEIENLKKKLALYKQAASKKPTKKRTKK